MIRLTPEIVQELRALVSEGTAPSFVPAKYNLKLEAYDLGVLSILGEKPWDNPKWSDERWIDQHHHKEQLWAHLVMTGLNILVETGDLTLAVAGFLHDIGKPSTYVLKTHTGKDQVSFPGHAVVGAQMILSDPAAWVAPFGSHVMDVSTVINLTAQHMCGKYCLHSDECSTRTLATSFHLLRTAYGDQFVKNWLTLHRADGLSRMHDGDNDYVPSFEELVKTDPLPLPCGPSDRTIVTVTGLIGTGKTPFCNHLAAMLEAEHVSRDQCSLEVLVAEGILKTDEATQDDAGKIHTLVKNNGIDSKVNRYMVKKIRASESKIVIVESLMVGMPRAIGNVIPWFQHHYQIVLVEPQRKLLDRVANAAARKGMSEDFLRKHYATPVTSGFSTIEKSSNGAFRDFMTLPQLVHTQCAIASVDWLKSLLHNPPETIPIPPVKLVDKVSTENVYGVSFVIKLVESFLYEGLSLQCALSCFPALGFNVNTYQTRGPEWEGYFSICYRDPKPLHLQMCVNLRNAVFKLDPKTKEVKALMQAMPVMAVTAIGEPVDEWVRSGNGDHYRAAKTFESLDDETKVTWQCKEDGMHIRIGVFDEDDNDSFTPEMCEDPTWRRVMEYSLEEYKMTMVVASNAAIFPTDENVVRFITEGFCTQYGIEEFTPEAFVDRLMPFFQDTMGCDCTHATASFEAMSNQEFPGLVLEHRKPQFRYLGTRFFLGGGSEYVPYTAVYIQHLIRVHKIYDPLYWKAGREFGRTLNEYVIEGKPMPPAMNWHQEPFESLEGFVVLVRMKDKVMLKVKAKLYLTLHHPGHPNVTHEDLVKLAHLEDKFLDMLPLARKLRQVLEFKDYAETIDAYKKYEHYVDDHAEERPMTKKGKPIRNGMGLLMNWYLNNDHPELPELIRSKKDTLNAVKATFLGKPVNIPRDLKKYV